MKEIVYSETRPGVMETDRERYERKDREFRRLDRLGWLIMPAFALFLMLMHVVSEWFK